MRPEANIPSAPKLPVLGHLHQIPSGGLIQHLTEVSGRHPEGIFHLWFGKFPGLFVSDPDLVAELSDENRFRKYPSRPLKALRPLVGDGLFTAFTEEPNWGRAHRILLPAFSQRAMRGYFDLLRDVAEQLAAKWERLEGQDLHVSDDMTRLTLESIALAGFGRSFDSFEREELDPFLQAMGVALEATLKNLTRLPIQQKLAPRREARAFDNSVRTMNEVVDRVIAERRARPDPQARDLLNLMLTAVDPETGEGLDDLNIRYQVLTFLIAGHETTSGLLTFALHLLLRHPHVLARAYAEVDRVLPGDARLEYGDVAKLDVIGRVLDETLRLWPTAPGFTVAPRGEEVIGGRYRLPKDRQVNVVVPALHRSPKAWDRPEEFDIDRWLPERAEELHPHAYKPFGNGARACIGRQFALLEAKIALAVVLQRFALHDPHGYRLEIKETLTIKPHDFFVRARRRRPEERLAVAAPEPAATAPVAVGGVAGAGQRLTVLHGTSLGTARDVAEQAAARAMRDGFDTVAMSLDDAFDAPPADGVLVIVTATYNGRAPDSAVRLERAIAEGRLAEVRWPEMRFAVLGIGNSQWPNYQAFPKLLDRSLEGAGARRLVPRGEADGNGDFEGGVDAFVAKLWASLGATASAAEDDALELTLVDRAAARREVLPGQAQLFEVLENRELVTPAPPSLWDFAKEAPRGSTRHLRLRLPEGTTYRTGDHLAVYARNRPELVDEALQLFGVASDALVRLDGGAGRLRHLPLGRTLPARQLLADYVDLQETASRRAVERLGGFTRCPHTRAALERLAREDYQAEVGDKRVTLLDLLRAYPALDVPLAAFVAASPAIQPRFYSIASSPRVSPDAVDLLVGTLSAPAWSGAGRHEGFASTYLRDAAPDERVLGFLRSPNPPFAPPEDASAPLILVGPGTGFAPFRGFLQDREARRAAGEVVGESLLFFGCRHPDHDWFFRDEMERWVADGATNLHLAFSAVDGHPWRFVQDALWAEQEAVWGALQRGAQLYVCGDGRFMAPAVRDALVRIHQQQAGATHAHASAWLEELIEDGRYHQDVFGFGK
ncbi:MAG: NADPH-cytochrome P450 reductase [uncultured Sphingomonadaceae bacterium]|uniref:Bifunctional cytochrome P450/NADPH--P450 reductase n=1 Tax=uncultured Sphingomonadaceae bacterium TaxID=169976 RepID=A0A6J4TBN1_9SPHN|nr:MAG: NADPH-cytochrome P450 reductase [uncultured Sphingomonadaceae bacterium]